MTRHQWETIIADIEKNLEGDGYWLWFRLLDGDSLHGAWRPIGNNGDVISVELDDQPPKWLPLSSIVFVQLHS